VTDNSAAVPNDVLIAFNSLFTEAGSVTLQGLTGSIVGTDQYLVLSSGVPITSVSDPALSVILQPLVFDFQIVSGTLIDPNTLGFALSLSQIISVPAPVPEPATLALTFFVLLAGSLWRVRRSAE
jgi:hypothetical protein